MFVFFPTLRALFERWLNDSRYNHGYLVPLFSVYLIYRQRNALKECTSGNVLGLGLILFGLSVRALGALIYFDWLDALALLPCLAGVAVLWGGWSALRLTWPAIAFLLFMIPLPFRFETALSGPLQQLATAISSRALRILGMGAFSEGNVIRMGDVRIGVVEACSGISMLVIFFALCTGVAILIQRPLWERFLVVLMAIPIALASNIIRIIVTGFLHVVAGPKLADVVFHDLAGWLMMPLALGLLWVASKLFNWMFPVKREEDDDPLFDRIASPPEQQWA